jgi:hypothetical protein
VTAGGTPQLARGVRLRRDLDGSPLLLVPDGRRSFDEIVGSLCARFGVARDEAARDVDELFDRLARRGYVNR